MQDRQEVPQLHQVPQQEKEQDQEQTQAPEWVVLAVLVGPALAGGLR